MVTSTNRYGSILATDNSEEVELLPPHAHGQYIGTVDAGGPGEVQPIKKAKWTRHHCLSYTLAAVICVVSARYWHTRSNDAAAARSSRVPMPPALSDVDPTSLGFRSTTREGLALPSKAWGEHYLNHNGKEEDVFTPLPTNEWYGNLISHVAANNPFAAKELAHVYTIPYILGVSPLSATKLPHSDKDTKVKQTMAGIDLNMPVVQAASSNMQMVFNSLNGVSLGAIVKDDESDKNMGKKALTSYVVDPDEPISPLGVSLKWNHVNMKSSIVRGMPYGTVRFGKDARMKSVLPTILSGDRPVSVLLDSDEKEKVEPIMCGSFTGEPIDQFPNNMSPISKDGKAHIYSVKREVIFRQNQSDFTWVVFFSKPVKIQCYSESMPKISVPGAVKEVQFRLDVVEVGDGEHPDDDLVVRMSLLDECTSGKDRQHCEHMSSLGYDTITGKKKVNEYLKVLREGAVLYPKSPLVGTKFPDESDEEEDRVTNVVFDWDATSVHSLAAHVVPKVRAAASLVAASSGLRATPPELAPESPKIKEENDAFIMFALPHHLESLPAVNSEADDSLCLHTFHGRTCLVQGSVWNLPVAHGKPQSFLADRPPMASVIPSIAEALAEDIQFKLADNILRGATDTYFSGKILAKMGRIIEINEELKNLKSGEAEFYNYSDADDTAIEEAESAAAEVTLPSEEEVESLLDDLQLAVEIWLNPGGKEKGGAEAEYIYDASWGGLINCGCKYTFEEHHKDTGYCDNTFPDDCPAIADVNQDFGNGWYNDHHFHYGYHIYAAAVVAKHRPEWGRKYYDQILLYIRDIANPSAEDSYFPQFRQKDWYLGNSWAAGLMSMELSPHGREQESSSEAIAAFEGIALYGDAMMEAFAEDEEKFNSARLVRNVGELLTAMEVKAANRFWHVWGSKNDQKGSADETKAVNDHPHINPYPAKYEKPVVGMMYDTMASFQTWFAPEDVVSYGIQLMPFTAVSERRDDPEWSKILYPIYAESCKIANEDNDNFCEDNGWSIMQTGVLAETGEIDGALELADEVPEEVYASDGGCGNSLTNTRWFISTRKQPDHHRERDALDDGP